MFCLFSAGRPRPKVTITAQAYMLQAVLPRLPINFVKFRLYRSTKAAFSFAQPPYQFCKIEEAGLYMLQVILPDLTINFVVFWP